MSRKRQGLSAWIDIEKGWSQYSDEISFQARVHPRDRMDRLSERTLDKVHKTMKSVLQKTIRYQAEAIHVYSPARHVLFAIARWLNA